MTTKLILKNHQSPGDIVMMSYAVKSLHESQGKKYLTDIRTSADEIFANNPFITKIADDDPEAQVIKMEYPSINQSNQNPVKFVTAFTTFLSQKLGVPIHPSRWSSSIFIGPADIRNNIVGKIIGRNVPYWVIDAGNKSDFTAKAWAYDRYQKIVDMFPDVWFVQIGKRAKNHFHPRLKGNNLIDLVGKTTLRDLIAVVYYGFGVLTPVSLPMHLSYAIQANPIFKRRSRACIVIAGGREPNDWEQGPNQQFLHTCGMLSCCSQGGCWKSRVVKLNDGDEKDKSLCEFPVLLDSGQTIPKCLEMISVEEVARLVDKYMSQLEYTPRF